MGAIEKFLGVRGVGTLCIALLAGGCATMAPSASTRPGLAEVEAQLTADIVALSADDFAGRYPGTPGEAKTQRWLIDRYAGIGLQPGAGEGDWTQEFTLVRRAPGDAAGAATATLTHGARKIALSQGLLAVHPGLDEAVLSDVPIVGLAPDIGELAPRSLANRAVAVPASALAQLFAKIEVAAPKALVVTAQTDEEYARTKGLLTRGRWRLASDTSGPAVLLLSPEDGARLEAAIGETADRAPDAHGVIAYDTILDARIVQQTDRIETANVIGRMPGAVPGAGAVLLLAHWDHLGDACGPPDAADRLCNGAVDNASGIAVMVEAVRIALRDGPLDRDVVVLATSAEELGLLGARAFVADPPFPLPTIAAAFNLDTMAIAPRGTPVVVLGAGKTALDAGIAQVVQAEGRAIVPSDMQDAFLPRQDGWALLSEGVPTVLVSSALADTAAFGSFMQGPYHGADDDVEAGLELGGAAEDTLLHAALIRHFANLQTYPGGED